MKTKDLKQVGIIYSIFTAFIYLVTLETESSDIATFFKFSLFTWYLIKNETWHTLIQILTFVGVVYSIIEFFTPPIIWGIVDIIGMSAIFAYAWRKQKEIE